MPLLDLVYIALILGVFALIMLAAKGVEKLGPPSRGSAHRGAMSGEERG